MGYPAALDENGVLHASPVAGASMSHSNEVPESGGVQPRPPHQAVDPGSLRLFVEQAPVAVAMFDREMRYVAASRQWRADYGLADRTYLGLSQYELFPDLPEHWKAIHQRCLQGEAAHADEEAFERADGSTQWVRWTIHPWRDAAGAIAGLVAFAEDLTRRRQAEMRLRASEAALAAELDAMRRLQALAARSVTATDLETILGDIVDTAIAIAHADFGHIQLLDAASGDLRIVAQRGLPDWWVDYWQSESKGPCACRTALEQNARVVVADVLESPLFTAAAREVEQKAGVRAMQSTPLVSRAGRTLGMFSTHYRTPRRPSDDGLRLLDSLARQAADIIDHIQAVQALKASEAQRAVSDLTLHAAIDAMTDAVFISDAAGHFVLFNEAFVTFHRFPSKDACARSLQEYASLFDVYLPSGAPATFEQWAISRALRGETAVDQEYQLRRTDTGERWIGSYNLAPIRDEAGAVVGAVVIGRDITAQKAAADALRASEARYRDLAEQVPEGIFAIDAAGQLLDANQAGCELFGYTLGELRARTVGDLLSPDDRARAAEVLAALGSGAPARSRWTFCRQDGTVFVGEVSGRQLRDGSGRSQGVVRDITDRERAEAAIRRLEVQHAEDSETLRALLASTTQGILEVDERGLIQSVNPALESLLGWSPGELVGQPHALLIPVDRQAAHARLQAEYWAAPLARPMAGDLDLVVARKDGTTLPVEVSLAPVTTSQGQAVFAFVTDISVRRRAEAARAVYARELEDQSEQLRQFATALTLAEQRAREELSRTLHDGLQQSLFGVKMKLDRADQRLADGTAVDRETLGRARHDLQDAIAEARTLAVELAPPTLHDGGLAAALTWLAGWVRRKHGLTVDVTADADANPHSDDVRTLAFISVRELLFNVVKHAGVDRATLTMTSTTDDRVRITVADDGAGFDPVEVWDPGRPRVGLGLLGLRERVRLMGGQLDIDSAPGRGTRSTIVVPRGGTGQRSPAPGPYTMDDPAAAGRAPAAAAGRSLRILIADDHAIVREGLRDLLAHQPDLLLVGEAADGEAALAQARVLAPDVVIMDVSMPGLGGVDATRRLRDELPHVQVLALSTHPRPDEGHPIEIAGASGYFCKGDDTHLLLARLISMRRALDTPDQPA